MSYSDYFNRAMIKLDKLEGTLSSSASDSANIDGTVHTAFGIARKHHKEAFDNVMSAHKSGNIVLRDSLIKDFYWKEFWNTWYDEIELYELAEVLFTYGVNTNPRSSVKLLQTALVYFFNSNIVVDGGMGDNTLTAINTLSSFSQKTLLNDFIHFIKTNYLFNQFDTETRKKFWRMLLNEPRNKNKHNINGWINRYS